MPMSNHPVDVYIPSTDAPSTGVGFVYSTEDAFRLRTVHRLLGDFIGSLPKHPSQNQFLSLPLIVSHDELTLGFSLGIIRLISDAPSAYPHPQPGASAAFSAARDADAARQADITLAARAASRAHHIARAPQPTRKRPRPPSPTAVTPPPPKAPRPAVGLLGAARAALRRIAHGLAPHLVAATSLEEAASAASAAMVAEAAAASAAAAAAAAAVAEREALARTQARAAAAIVIPVAAREGEAGARVVLDAVPPPRGVGEARLKSRAAVFRDLYMKGYYMSCGAKFGADFLAYAGEPLMFHAALAVVVSEADEELTAKDVVALGRLGGSTRKRTAIAYPDEQAGGVSYVGIQWEETLP